LLQFWTTCCNVNQSMSILFSIGWFFVVVVLLGWGSMVLSGR
jgi:hypothetical protein